MLLSWIYLFGAQYDSLVTVVYPTTPSRYAGILVYGSLPAVPLSVPDSEWTAHCSTASAFAVAAPSSVRVHRGIVCDSGATAVMYSDLRACTYVDWACTMTFTMVADAVDKCYFGLSSVWCLPLVRSKRPLYYTKYPLYSWVACTLFLSFLEKCYQ